MFVSFEGIDCAGKSTQIQHLANWLHANRDIKSTIFRNPGSTPVGETIRSIVKGGGLIEPPAPHTQVLLFAAARCDLVPEIRKATRDGMAVLVDRWSLSTLAYQGAQSVAASAIRKVDDVIGLRPDLSIVIDIPVDVAMERLTARADGGGPAADHFERREFLEKVRHNYLDESSRGRDCDRIRVVDGVGAEKEVALRIAQVVDAWLAKRK